LNARVLRVCETVYDGHFDQPKTKRSARITPIGTETAEILAALRPAAGDPKALVIPRRKSRARFICTRSRKSSVAQWKASRGWYLDPNGPSFFLVNRQTAGRRDSVGNAVTSSSKEQRLVFTLEICQSSRKTGQDCSDLVSTHMFKRCAQVEFLSVYHGVLRYDPAGLASASCLQQTLDVFDSLNVPFPKFEFGVYLPRYRSRKSSVEPTKMCE
jgi:hypothetical protein